MRHVLSNRPASSKQPEPSHHPHADLPKKAAPAPALSHRQAREQLALLLDETTDLALCAALQRHVAECHECCQELSALRQAEAWLRAQPREAPEMVALEGATWAAIQEQIAPRPQEAWAELQALLAAQPVRGADTQPGERELVVVGAMSDEPVMSLSLQPPVPAPTASVPSPLSLPSSSRSWLLRPHKLLVAVLAASFLMTSMAALFLAHLAQNSVSPSAIGNPQPTQFADMLDPGLLTTALSFDPISRHLFTLSSDQRFDCPRGAHCPYAPSCLRASSLDVVTGRRQDVLNPACVKQEGKGDANFTALFDDVAFGQVLAVSSDQQVMSYSSRAAAPGATYRLACCNDQDIQAARTLLDQRDHLLLTAGVNTSSDGAWVVLAAQDTRTGNVAYQTALTGEGKPARALFSEATDWLYLWTGCATFASGVCIDAYEGKSGSKVATWEGLADETPLAADPAQAILYVRHDQDNGQSETLALDAKTGAVRGVLPAAWALGVNARLHHAYLLSEAGVTVADTRTWQVLSTLPVLGHDRGWTAPTVDEQQDRVYVPTALGKVLKVQDTPAGQLSFGTPTEQAVLNADRVMENGLAENKNALDPWQVPLGPGITSLYYSVQQTTSDGWALYGVPARLETSVNQLASGSYAVLIALSWSHTTLAPNSSASTPPLLSSYPYTHTWRYQVPAVGDAVLSGEEGDALARCC